MNHLSRNRLVRRMAALLLSMQALFVASLVQAQGSGGGASIDITTRSTETVWYGEWWVWAVGIAVFLIIIVALTNRGGRSTA